MCLYPVTLFQPCKCGMTPLGLTAPPVGNTDAILPPFSCVPFLWLGISASRREVAIHLAVV